MDISVIVPFHGEHIYLSDCLDSLEEQSFRGFEVILVCDDSKAKIEKEYSFPLEIIKLSGCGVAAARNEGLHHATGDYVFFLDCDDYIDSDTLEKMWEQRTELVFGEVQETWYKRAVFYENGQTLDAMNGILQEKKKRSSKSAYKALIRKECGMYCVSVHSMLIKKELLLANEIRFDESQIYYSDYDFVTQLLVHAKTPVYCGDARYIKRKHNDPINLPALEQVKDARVKTIEAAKAYQNARNAAVENENITLLLDAQFGFFLEVEGGDFLYAASDRERADVFAKIAQAADSVSLRSLEGASRYRKKLVRLAKQQNEKAFMKSLRWRRSLQTLKRIMLSRAQLKKFIYRNVFAKQSLLENTVLLESFFGKSYSDSPKRIFEYLNETYPGKYRYVWIMNEKRDLPYPAKQIKRFRISYFYYLARSKYIVFNSRQPQYFIKRDGNVFLETWHGTPLKKLVFDMEEVTSASPLYKEQFYIQTRSWDYLVAPNEFSAEIFGHAFMYDGEMLRYGYPRNDILYRGDKDIVAKKIKEALHIPLDKKVILYAPTWRDDEFYGAGKYKFTLQLKLDEMKKALGEDWIVLLRTHYFVADSLDVSQYGSFVYNVCKYDDISELYLISDLLITDYSSVFFDYANLKRPMLFFTYDLEKYRDILRGFYIDMEEELPGPLLFTTEEIIEAIENINEISDKYKDKYEQFYNKFCDFEDGNAAKNIVDAVFNKTED